ncbi:SAM-dependent methyltransferase [Catellatospora tritici]|uniref:SAM-dependent methyltransferase n=1 Tax=Catellatospora tritici TaxID=2851566 RepID=UPI001C2CDF0A|nr:methyltransferase domain-containing protein [Catellatospora tritici]MBV1852782.1 methyltransferase domain-containing protein [Catellatospora tritici]
MTTEAEATAGTERVRRYYDNNAAAFERLGQGGASIHRAVWGPGVTTRADAFHHVDELILAALPPQVAVPSVLDLGCGLGASLLHLASRTDLTGEGVTISRAQAVRAAELIEQAGLGARVRCREGNYLSLPDDLAGSADLAFSIEAFIHSPDADGYFREAARCLRPGGRLIVCDDFRTPVAAPDSPCSARRMAEFRTGWHVGSLLTVEEVRAVAARHGLTLVRDLDLTAYLELRRPRDRFISALLAVGRVFRPSGPYWQSLVGGDALQWALLRGLLNYRFLELRRAD